MRIPVVYLLYTAALLVSTQSASLDTNSNDLESVMGFASSETDPDSSETLSYLLPRLGPQYRSPKKWNSLSNQDFLLDTNGISNKESEERYKRHLPSLSIVNPIDVLRQKLILEIARKQFREQQKQAEENRKLMQSVGKRGRFLRQPNDIYRLNQFNYDM